MAACERYFIRHGEERERERETAVGVFVKSILLHRRGRFLSGFRKINYLFGGLGSEELPVVAFMLSYHVGGADFKEIWAWTENTLT